mgnify:CR=1 FL=1
MKRMHWMVFWIAALTLSSPLAPDAATAQTFSMSASADLDGDGKMEKITLQPIADDASRYRLSVDSASVEGKLGDEVDGLQVIDIDTRDRFREVAVHTEGSSSDDEYRIYGFDGSRLYEMGCLVRWPKFQGNGIVLVDDWRGFWSQRDKYVLTADRRLGLVPQDMHAVSISARVEKSFPIYRTPGSAAVVANLMAGSEIQLLVAKVEGASGRWYMVKSSTNLIGWAHEDTIFANLSGLPIAD